MNKIAVIGLGYVGLPLALLAESKGFLVTGIDLDKSKIKKLQNNEPTIDDEIANKQIKTSKIDFTSDMSAVANVDIAIICVPTPVDESKTPDITLVKSASISAAKHMKNGSLLIIESTINPGVCDEIVIPAIEEETDHSISKTLHIAHCPERINPGDPKWHVGNINRVVGANSDEGLDVAYDFYSKLVDAKIKKMGSIKEAEAVKIVENSFRDINIAFVNELAMSFSELGININNVIDGAATKPFAFMAHYPGIGVGGHCIPVDPYYLIEYARGKGFNHEFLSLARSINESMPIYAIDQLEKSLIEKTKHSLKDSKVAVLGLSYKPNVGDDRESPAYTVISTLEQRGATIQSYDPYIPHNSSVDSLDAAIKDADAVVLVTAHDEFKEINIEELQGVSVFIDGRNLFKDRKAEFSTQNIEYKGIGV